MNRLNDTIESKSKLDSLSALIQNDQLASWRTGSITQEDLLLTISDACVDELDKALSKTSGVSQPDTSNWLKFKHCHEVCQELIQRLESPSLGATIVDGFPAERYNELDNRKLCGAFSSLIGELMVQNKDGVTLYDVKNKNPEKPDKVRKSITNLAQPFHTDGGWHRKPAKYVGLYCVRNAKSGGGSKVTSMLTAFEAMKSHPEHLNTLLQNHPWDMQGEHAAHENGIQMNPIFESHEKQFLSRYYDSYVRNGYKLKHEAVSDELDAALRCLADIINKQPRVKFAMTGGQFQYLNNWTLLHAREAFDDTELTPEEETRHVIRVWNH